MGGGTGTSPPPDQPVPLNLTDDYQIWANDFSQTVTHTSVRDSGNLTAQVTHALRRQISSKEAAISNGVYTTADVIFSLATVLTPNTPKPRDLLTDNDNVVWTVLAVDKATINSRWRLTCRALGIAADLQDVIDIETPAMLPNAQGVEVAQWVPRLRQIAARIQPVTGEETTERDLIGTKVKYEIFVGQGVTVSTRERVLWHARNKYLDIVGYRQPQRIDELPLIEAELNL